MTITERKGEARKVALGARNAAHASLSDDAKANAVRHLKDILATLGTQRVAGYMPIRSEIDPRAALASYLGPVCMPVVVAAGQPLQFRPWSPQCAMVPGAFGAAIPQDPTVVIPQVVVLPLVAFDRSGFRLGYGGGFYDRTLAQLQQTGPIIAIGFAYSAQELPQVPKEATDQPLDYMVTETGVIEFARS